MLLKMVHDGDDAEDLMIETLGRPSAGSAYSPQFAFSTWSRLPERGHRLHPESASRRCSARGFTDAEGDTMEIQVADDGLDPGQTLEKQQRVNRMREVVARSPRYRRLVELRYFEEYSYDEISKELDLPLGTVKAQLFRARASSPASSKSTGSTLTVAPTEQDRAVQSRWTPWPPSPPTSAPCRSSTQPAHQRRARPAVPGVERLHQRHLRKDIDQFFTRHVLHSLTIARVLRLNPARVSSTWAPRFPHPRHRLSRGQLTLCDSIGKKIKVVNAVSQALGLGKRRMAWAESLTDREPFDFVISRAVTRRPPPGLGAAWWGWSTATGCRTACCT